MYEVHIPGWMGDSLITSTKNLKEASEEAQRVRDEYNDGNQYKGPTTYVVIKRVVRFKLFGWYVRISKKVSEL